MDQSKLLGEEKISKLLFKFSIPCVVGLLIGALYNIVDQIFIGNSSLGYAGNAATGVSFPVICIANAFAWCIGDAAAAFLSICSGQKDNDSAHKCVGTGLTTSFIISIILTIICCVFARPLMNLYGADAATIDLATDYFFIIALFFPFYLMFNVMNSMIRADGSPTYAMIAMLSGAVLNIILDPVCIYLLDWGIKGAAFATVVGQVVSFVLCAIYFFKPKTFKLTKKSFLIDWKLLKKLIVLGGSTFIVQISLVIMTLVSNITLRKFGALSKYGSTIPLSVFSIQTKVYTIISNIVVGIALGGQPILGYNYGANNIKRVKETYKLILLSSLTVGILATILIEAWPQGIILMFGKQNDLYMEFAVTSFRIFLSLCFVTCFIKISSIVFQSIGKPIHAMVASILRDTICFVSLTLGISYLMEHLNPGNGIYGILIASPISDIIAGTTIAVITIIFFKKLSNKKIETSVEALDTSIIPSKPGSIITISREHGTAGKQIAKLVAKKLNVPFYSKEITYMVAKESGLANEYIDNDFENIDKYLNELYLSTNVLNENINAQSKIIKKIADNGQCVIVGRAACHVLKDYDNVINIFIYGSEKTKINNIMEMYGDSYEDAKKHMHKSDEARSNYFRNISGKEWKDVSNYDLCIDANLGKEKTAEIIYKYIKNRTNNK